MVTAAGYEATRARLVTELEALPAGAPVRLGKRTSNLFRQRAATSTPRLDVSGLAGVLSVDPVAHTADVLGMTTYEDLVAATLAHGLMPKVVPQLRTITIGGAVVGLGIEASSFRAGLPHESVRSAEVLTGDGRVLTVDRDGEHSALFAALPNSYGTLGYALRLSIELEPVRPYVRLRHVRFGSYGEVADAIGQVVADGAWAGEPVGFVDGVVFGPAECYLCLGSWTDSAPYTSDYTGRHIYYRSIQARTEDYLTVDGYLWRWDTDWFWCSGAFGVQNPRLRPLLPRRLLRSDVYWKIVALENRFHVKARVDAWRGLPARESVVQDVEIAVERLPQFLTAFDRDIGMSPVWLCPLRLADPDTRWDLYELDPLTTYVNVGFWGTVPLEEGQPDGDHNRTVEALVTSLGGRKSLYSNAYYDRDEFWRLYNGAAYEVLKKTYDPDSRLYDLYQKCVERR